MSRLRIHDDEEGVALVMVLLAVIVLSGLAVVFFSRAVSENRFSDSSRNHETAIHTAESAADNQIGLLNLDNDHITTYPGGAAQVTVSSTQLIDEEAWALSLLTDLRPDEGVESEAWVATDTGEAYAVRPLLTDTAAAGPMNAVYAVGAVPAFGAPNAKIRVVKLQIDKDRFTPEYALLTEGSLKFGGNAAIVVPGCDATTPASALLTCTADVHTNGEFTNPGTSSTIEGRVSQSDGTCPSKVTAVNSCVDSTDGVEDQFVPEFSARDFYSRVSDSAGAFDLCPPGTPDAQATVRTPSGGIPCTGSVVWPIDSSSPSDFRGWKWQAKEWRGSSITAGIFYVYQADAKVTGTDGAVQQEVSIFVEQNPSAKSSSGGLDVSGNPRMQAGLEGVLFVADADLDMQGNASAGSCGVTPGAFSGFIGVGEQLKTMGTVELRGAIIVRDRADDHNLVKRNNDGIAGTMCLEFDADLAVNFRGGWVITYWNEL